MADRDNLKDRAYTYLRDAIVSGEIDDGSQHSVYRLAEQLGMSRTPVREAVLQLAEAGLVTVQRNRGILIHGMTVQKLRDIFELRLLLEVPATYHAAVQGDVELHNRLTAATSSMSSSLAERDEPGFREHDRAFHDHIALSSGNRQLRATLDGLRDVIHDPGIRTSFGNRDPQEVINEHAAIARAITEGNARDSVHAMRDHLVRTGTILLDHHMRRTGQAGVEDWAERLHVPFVT